MDNNEQDIEKLTNFLNDIFGVSNSEPENEPWEPKCQEGEPECQEENNNQNNMKKNGHYENTKPSGSSEGKMKKIGPKDSATEPPHYKNLAIDTLELMSVNFSDEAYMGFLEGNVLKYVMRYKMKNGLEDLIKAQRYLEILIERQEMKEAAKNN